MIADQIMVRGLPMELHPVGEAVSDHIRRAGDFYEASILDYLAVHFPDQGTVVDAGANIGNHSLYWSAVQPAASVWAFEPLPANLDLLERNLAPYAFAHPLPVALSDRPGTLRMEPYPSNMGRSRVADDGEVEVAALTLDSYDFQGVTLLKIDVEDHEHRLLAGAQDTIARCHPLVLVEDGNDTCGPLLPGYRCIVEWPGSNHLWQWVGP